MLERRQSGRDKVIYGGIAEIDERGGSRDCVVRNISENGARIEFSSAVRRPKKQISLTIAKKGPRFPGPHHLVARQFRGRCVPLGAVIRATRLRSRGTAAQEREEK